jgi:hypothetical protein
MQPVRLGRVEGVLQEAGNRLTALSMSSLLTAPNASRRGGTDLGGYGTLERKGYRLGCRPRPKLLRSAYLTWAERREADTSVG